MTNLSDKHIMSEIKAGRIDYVTMLFDRYNTQLLNYYYRNTGNLDDSKDLTQNVFLRIMKYANSYKPDIPFKFWLFKTAKNLLRSYFSNKQKQTSKAHEAALYDENIEEESTQERDDEILFKAISKLPNEYRELIILSRFTKFTYMEIAEIHQTTEASVKNKLYRAMIKLREIYFETEKTENHEL